MTVNKGTLAAGWVDPDDAPDLSTAAWQERFAATEVKRGRPPLDSPKVSTTLRLDADVLAHFQNGGPGWQTRMNAALRRFVEGT
jgi:uncharacterized protein (DUF4415 family)